MIHIIVDNSQSNGFKKAIRKFTDATRASRVIDQYTAKLTHESKSDRKKKKRLRAIYKQKMKLKGDENG